VPESYEPEFFSAQTDGDKKSFKFAKHRGKVVKIKIGQIASKDHVMELRISHLEHLFEEDSKPIPSTCLVATCKDPNLTDEIIAEPKASTNEAVRHIDNIKTFILASGKASGVDCIKQFEGVIIMLYFAFNILNFTSRTRYIIWS
jgi:hypothetical protein